MWEERWGNMDAYNMITTEQLLEEMHHVMNDKDLRKKVHSFLPFLFKVSIVNKKATIGLVIQTNIIFNNLIIYNYYLFSATLFSNRMGIPWQ